MSFSPSVSSWFSPGSNVPQEFFQSWALALEQQRDMIDLREWSGIDLTGNTANQAQVQAALAESASTGKPVFKPPGITRLDALVQWPAGASMIGAGKASTYTATASYFWINHSGSGFQTNGGIGQRVMRGVNFYRTQPSDPGASAWVPNVYDYDVRITGASDVIMTDIHFHNPHKALEIVGSLSYGGNGRIYLDYITGQPMYRGINATHIYDVLYADQIHFWPYVSAYFSTPGRNGVYAYQRANAEAIQIGRCDNAKFGRVFTYGYSRGVDFYYQGSVGNDALLPPGEASEFYMSVAGFDNSGVGLLVNSGTGPSGDGPDITIDKMVCGSNPAETTVSTEPLVWLLGSNANVKIDDLYCYYSTVSAVKIQTGTGNVVDLDVYRSVSIDNGGSGDAEFDVATGNTLRINRSPETSSSIKYLAAGTGVIESPDWRSYTPTLTVTGSFTSVTPTGKFRRVGKNVEVDIRIVITTVGTASGTFSASLPFTAAAGTGSIMAGAEIVATGKSVKGVINPSTSTVTSITYHDNTSLLASGVTLIISGTYEAA